MDGGEKKVVGGVAVIKMPDYVLDSNTLIESARRFYPFDMAMKFWDFLVLQGQNKVLCSIDKVQDEILRGDDELKDWSQHDFHEFFCPTAEEVIVSSYAKIVKHVQAHPQYNQRAKDEFMRADNADAWVLAYAKAHDLTIVSHEKYDAQIRKRVLIPNVCAELAIAYCDLFDMLRKLAFKF